MRPSKSGYRSAQCANTQANTRTPSGLLDVYERQVLAHPSQSPTRLQLELELEAIKILAGSFEYRTLSPVTVLGTNKVLAGISQNTVLSTVRDLEVLADPTTALALEAAHHRKTLRKRDQKDASTVRVASCARILRLQDFSKAKGFSPHFEALGLISAGRDTGHRRFEISELTLHLSTYLTLLLHLPDPLCVRNIKVYISDTHIMHQVLNHHGQTVSDVAPLARTSGFSAFDRFGIQLPKYINAPEELTESKIVDYSLQRAMREVTAYWDAVITPLQTTFPNVHFCIHLDRTAGANYYQGPCFKVRADTIQGQTFPLVDGGMVNWSQTLINSPKERMLSSGLGIELLCAQFATTYDSLTP